MLFLQLCADLSKKSSTFLDNLQTITQVGNIETRPMTTIFLSTFSALTVCNILFFYLKIVKIYFDVIPPLWSILVCKTTQFCAKANNSDNIMLFCKVDTPRLLKIHIMFCSSSGAKKRYQLMD